MKNCLYAFLITTLVLLAPIGVNGYALSSATNSVGDLSAEALLSSELPGDTVIHFPDPMFEAEVRRIIDKPTGDLIANDVAGITRLIIGGSGITDMTGIEYFTALTELSCGMNDLRTLDVSQNTMLTKLTCNIGGLRTLNVSGNPLLKALYCENNLLTTLDVSQNPALEELVCYKNQLTTLDMSHNPKLTLLDCWKNQLTTLDVWHNPALKKLDCGSNQLTTLDVSHNPTLAKLYCHENRLTTLDVSHNPALESLFCLKNLFSDKSAIIGLDDNELEYFDFHPQDL